jgi:hypothetical protein
MREIYGEKIDFSYLPLVLSLAFNDHRRQH